MQSWLKGERKNPSATQIKRCSAFNKNETGDLKTRVRSEHSRDYGQNRTYGPKDWDGDAIRGSIARHQKKEAKKAVAEALLDAIAKPQGVGEVSANAQKPENEVKEPVSLMNVDLARALKQGIKKENK